ncbi:glutamate--tRNA ligase MSE1 [Mycosarcoma maydis]|uniref:glutamate--tRNA ligase n=1 Tax=Mycosarcoma maydis TaxID=5270 RepID=A0A0D1CTV5_MYCMD|nr:glutamate--tRNA ligase MSE1 [Ustilago maydis 521]KIS69918.1 hypothetical protein UMAG_10154 [Ustilago maydis 521]|eukprot:XP_011388835.1 hypothetical protein UMAG_10154 [Ustilago maydis 521]
MSARRSCHGFVLSVRSLCSAARRRLYSTNTASAPSSSARLSARLRFAPSPTGYLHLGGLRTALFNHLYARALGGKWILRIEDTDQTRLVPGSISALQETLCWAKLDYDEGPSCGGAYGPYIQSERLDLYRSYAEKLIDQGKAYRDFRAEVVADDASKRGVNNVPLRDSYIAPDETEARHLISLGKPYVVRLRAPTKALDHQDLVYGHIHFPSDPLRHGTEDAILLKSNGWPTYHLASVVDDHEMAITHVLRGEEWLPSLPKHLWLYKALDFTPPKFAHLPLLVNADGTKLSKRTGDVRVESYRDKGVEPEALCNMLGLTGYNNLAYHQRHSEHDESAYDVLTMQDMINGFDICHVNRSRATVDLAKLYYLNARHVALKLQDARKGGGRDELVARLKPRLIAAFPEVDQSHWEQVGYVERVIELARGGTGTIYDIPAAANTLFRAPVWLPQPPKETVELWRRNRLIHKHFLTAVQTAHHQLAQLATSDWTRDNLHSLIATLPKLVTTSARDKIKKAAILAPLRFAISANERGAPLADLLLFLGKQPSLYRLKSASDAYEAGALPRDLDQDSV